MKRYAMSAMLIAGAGLVLASAAAGVAKAQSSGGDKSTPSSWNWEIKDGKRVPKGNRVTNADGSWREEIRKGNCVTIKEKTAAGEYKETRRCD